MPRKPKFQKQYEESIKKLSPKTKLTVMVSMIANEEDSLARLNLAAMAISFIGKEL